MRVAKQEKGRTPKGELYDDAWRSVVQGAAQALGWRVAAHDAQLKHTSFDLGGGRFLFLNGWRFGTNGSVAETVCKDKALTEIMLRRHGVPCVAGERVNCPSFVAKVNFGKATPWTKTQEYCTVEADKPVVVKPCSGQGGVDVHIAHSRREMEDAFNAIQHKYRSVIFSRFLRSHSEWRVFVRRCAGSAAAPVFALQKRELFVTGDGLSTVAELLARHEFHPCVPREKVIAEIPAETLQLRPAPFQEVQCGWRRNMAWGAVTVPVEPAEIPSELGEVAARAAEALGMRFGCVDILDGINPADLPADKPKQPHAVLEANTAVLTDLFDYMERGRLIALAADSLRELAALQAVQADAPQRVAVAGQGTGVLEPRGSWADRAKALRDMFTAVCAAQGWEYANESEGYLHVCTARDAGKQLLVVGSDLGVNTDAAVAVAERKAATAGALSQAGVPHVEHHLVNRAPDALSVVEQLSELLGTHPGGLVIKGDTGSGGTTCFAVTGSGDRGLAQIERAVAALAPRDVQVAASGRSGITWSPLVSVADEFRVITVGGSVVLEYRKVRPAVTGDGKSSLITLAAQHPVAKRYLAKWLQDPEFTERASRIPKAGHEELITWRHNLDYGARPAGLGDEETALREQLHRLATAALAAIGLRYAAVDIVLLSSGELRVLEVNSCPQWHNFMTYFPALFEQVLKVLLPFAMRQQ